VQRCAVKVWQEGGDFQMLLAAYPVFRKLQTAYEISANFDLGYHLREVDTIFARVFGSS
jgi:adenylosuccinate lyase